MTQREELSDDKKKLNWLLGLEKETLANMAHQQSKVIEKLQKVAKAQAVPEGWRLVPIEPTVDQFGGIARDVIQWMRFTESKNQHSESLVKWLKDMGNEIPEWLYSEPEINHLSKHVISKGTIAAIIYKAMLAAAPEQVKGGE